MKILKFPEAKNEHPVSKLARRSSSDPNFTYFKIRIFLLAVALGAVLYTIYALKRH